MANPVNESLTSWQPDAATSDSNHPTSNDNAGVGQAHEAMGTVRLLKSEMRAESIIKSWERWLGLKNIAGTGNVAFTYVSGTVFTVNDDFLNANRNVAVVGRRVRAFVSGAVREGTISASSFSSPSTTITVAWDSGVIDATLTEVQFGLAPTAMPSHRSRHISGGVDAFLSTDLLEAAVKRIKENQGAILTVGDIPAANLGGQWLQRNGSTIVAVTIDETKNAYGARHIQDTDPVDADGANGDIFFVHD